MTQFINAFTLIQTIALANYLSGRPMFALHSCSLPGLQGGVVCVFDSSKIDSRTISNAETDSKEKTDGPAGLISDETTINAVPHYVMR